MTEDEIGLASLGLTMAEPEQLALCQLADGDARRLLNLLEIASELAQQTAQLAIDQQVLSQLSQHRFASIDKQGDLFYDLLCKDLLVLLRLLLQCGLKK